MKSIYRILSSTAILGYGFPESSFQMAMELNIDLIAVDAGAVDVGPRKSGGCFWCPAAESNCGAGDSFLKLLFLSGSMLFIITHLFKWVKNAIMHA